MNMTIVNKNNNKKYNIYDITYDKSGYPHFLIYKDGQWIRMSAKHFRPYSSKDIEADLQESLKSMSSLTFQPFATSF